MRVRRVAEPCGTSTSAATRSARNGSKTAKDRRGRTLSCEDIKHYQKIVVALSETIRIMAEIDAVIEHHGGWPLVGSVMERSE